MRHLRAGPSIRPGLQSTVNTHGMTKRKERNNIQRELGSSHVWIQEKAKCGTLCREDWFTVDTDESEPACEARDSRCSRGEGGLQIHPTWNTGKGGKDEREKGDRREGGEREGRRGKDRRD